MTIEPATIGKEGSRFTGDEPAGILELGGESGFAAVSPVSYDLFAEMVGGNLVVRGDVRARIGFVCARCAEPYVAEVRDGDFLRVAEAPRMNESVDLTADIRESIILALPTIPVCDPGCRGMCGRCGANLNKEVCRCGKTLSGGGAAWKPLGGLKLK